MNQQRSSEVSTSELWSSDFTVQQDHEQGFLKQIAKLHPQSFQLHCGRTQKLHFQRVPR